MNTQRVLRSYVKQANRWPTETGDYLLGRMGLERRHVVGSVFTYVGLFTAALLVGGALGLLFAPSSGRKMRESMKESGWKLVDRARTVMPSA